ncbi:MAG: phage tail assembly chaperone [Pseudomonadota bacterium]
MTPWPALLRLAALRFGLLPEAFWRLSLAEWRALTDQTPDGLTRAGLGALMAAWPD